MKDLITSIASMLILMMFVMQFTANQVTYTKIAAAENQVRQFCLISENQGIIKSEGIIQLKEKLAGILDCELSQIAVCLSGGRADLRNTGEEAVSSDIEITMPVYGVIGAAGVLGISAEDNVGIHKSAGTIVLLPEPEE